MKKNLILILLIFLPIRLFGFSVNPMVVEIDPQATKSQKVYVLTNTSDRAKPVEISVAKPVVDENNFETLITGEGEEQFLIIPQQLTLPPNSRRSVKVFYVGDPINEEETYRIIFRELPIHMQQVEENAPTETTVDMKIVMEYQTRVWLTPGELKSELSVIEFEKSQESTPPKPVLNLKVANNGQRHHYLKRIELLLLTNNGKKVTLAQKQIRPMLGQVLLKDSQRTFSLTWEDEYPDIESISEIRIRNLR